MQDAPSSTGVSRSRREVPDLLSWVQCFSIYTLQWWRVPFQKGFISCYYQGGQEVWRKGVVRLLFPPADGGRMARGGVGQVKPVPLLIYLPGVGGALSGRVAASAWSVITRRRFALWPRKRGAQYSAPLS